MKDSKIWCPMCQTWVNRKELKYWSGNDRQHYLCPGCDSTLLLLPSLDELADRGELDNEEAGHA